MQIRAASGEVLPADLRYEPRGHAIEARIYAEDPAKKFAPQPGKITRLTWPEAGADLRIETGVEQGSEVTPFYDPLIAKVVAHGADRPAAIARLAAALAGTDLELTGPRGPAATNLAFLRQVLTDERFVGGQYSTGLAEALAAGR
jgi:acetyl-CoA carboxylase biotin carboxylase subunit/3-methylcrotonyl-CoA carboxylase alpha subunit